MATNYTKNKRLCSSLIRACSCKLWIESMKNDKEACYYRNINYCNFDGRAMCHQGKEKNWISNRIGNQILDNLNFVFFKQPKCLKTSNYPNQSFSFKAEKKVKKAKKEKRRWLSAGKSNLGRAGDRTGDLVPRRQRSYRGSNWGPCA